jgi:hypothetical protein
MRERDRIFISYREADSAVLALLLSTLLKVRFGESRVFFSSTGMIPGENFETTILAELERAAVIVAVIGPNWLLTDRYGNKLLNDENDGVRRELSYGLRLENQVTVVPLLVQGAHMLRETDAPKALPSDLQPLAKRQAIRMDKELPFELIETIEASLDNSPKSVRSSTHETVVILDAVDESSDNTEHPGELQATVALRTQFIKTMIGELPWNFRVHSPSVSVLARSALINSDLLTCQAVLLLVNNESLNSPMMLRLFELVAWRRALGMPLVSILFGGLTARKLKISLADYLGNYAVIEYHNETSSMLQEQVGSTVGFLRTYLDAEFAARVDTFYSEPATTWVRDVAETLAKASTSTLLALSEKLRLPRLPLDDRNRWHHLIAASLFVANLDDAYIFLRDAVRALEEQGVPAVTNDALVKRAKPIWVNLNTGRQILHAADLPPHRRLCELRLSQLRWAEHAVNRASARSLNYPSVSLPAPSDAGQLVTNGVKRRSVTLPSAAGEHKVAELLSRHDATLRQQLNLRPNDKPEFIAEQLFRVNRAVYAVLDSRNMGPRELRELVRELRKRFPGITFLLVAEQGTFSPPPMVALDRLDKGLEGKVAHYIAGLESLLRGDRE